MNLSEFITALYALLGQVSIPDPYSYACVVKDLPAPEQVRVALRGPDAVTISWKTDGMFKKQDLLIVGFVDDYFYDGLVPTVEFSLYSNFSNSIVATGNTTNYDNGKDWELFGTPAWFHNVQIQVMPSTKYYYRILFSTCTNTSVTYSFTSQPRSGDNNPINIAIVGDVGYDTDLNMGAPSQTIQALIEAANTTDLFLHVGDISYADEPCLELSWQSCYERRWNNFQNQLSPITAEKFYMTLPGNHEVTCVIDNDHLCNSSERNRQYRNFTAYLHRFQMPGNQEEIN